MADEEDCVGQIAKATGSSRKQVEDELGDMLDRAEEHIRGGEAPQDALGRVAQEKLAQLAELHAIRNRSEKMDMMKEAAVHRWYDKLRAQGIKAATLLEARLAGVNRTAKEFANRLSAHAIYVAKKKEWWNGLGADLEKEGLFKIFASKHLEREWTDELHELNKGQGGNPGATKNAQALKIAQIVHKWQKESIRWVNAEGGWVKSYSGYITKTSHSPDLIRRAGQDKWVDDTLARLDTAKTFGSADSESARTILREMWGKMAAGDHFQYSGPVDDIYPNLAAKASAHRELHFKTAEDWRQYNKLYGISDPTTTVVRAFDTAAKRVGLLRTFGSKPMEALERDIAYLKATTKDPNERVEFDSKERYLRNLYAQLDGSADRPVNRTAAKIVGGIMAFERMSKLGRVAFTHLASLSTRSSELRYWGAGFGERFGGMVSGMFRGAKDSDKRALADLLHEGFEARLHHIAQGFDVADATHGAIGKAENLFFRMTGISAVTSNQRVEAERIMARHMGLKQGTTWEKIGSDEQRVMRMFGIDKPEWEALNKVEWTKVGGKTYLTPDVAGKLSDDHIRDYLAAKGQERTTTLPGQPGGLPFGAITPEMVGRTRDALGLQLAAAYADRGDYAIYSDRAPRVRAMLFGATRPGDKLNMALKLLYQFKLWPAQMIEKTWGRELYGREGRMEKLAGITELVVASAILGTMSEAMRQVTQGQDPVARIKSHPFKAVIGGLVRSGAGTIAGDYLMGQFDRHGMLASANLLGPTFGQIDNVLDMIHGGGENERHPLKRAAADALYLAKGNIPFSNLWWSSFALEHLVLHRLQEWISPGYMQRYEQRMKKERGIDFLVSPSKFDQWERGHRASPF